MKTSLALVKNLRSNSEELHFADFKFVKIGFSLDYDLKRAQYLFSRAMPYNNDWFYERTYDGNEVIDEKIATDVEDTLLFLRLFKPGDLVFLNHCIEDSSGKLLNQLPYRVMTDIHTEHMFNIELDECTIFNTFRTALSSQNNLTSDWFKTARRFFLYGGGKEYNPRHNEVDRIVDYITALEAILVPERDGFIGRRLRERAVSLIRNHNIDLDDAKKLLTQLYDVRSTLIHGSDISSFMTSILRRNMDFETVIRKIFVEALKTLPKNDEEREKHLKELFDVSDQDRIDRLLNDFRSIKCKAEKSKCYDRISKYYNSEVQ